MSEYETYTYPQFSDKVLIVLFENVSNQKEMKEQLISGNRDYDWAFVNCENIVSREQVYSAVYKTLLDDHLKQMKSKTLHSEIIFDLAPFKNIVESLNKFGISPGAKNIVALKVLSDSQLDKAAQYVSDLKQRVNGTVVPFTNENLAKYANIPQIRKMFKLGEIQDLETIERAVIGSTQLKGA